MAYNFHWSFQSASLNYLGPHYFWIFKVCPKIKSCLLVYLQKSDSNANNSFTQIYKFLIFIINYNFYWYVYWIIFKLVSSQDGKKKSHDLWTQFWNSVQKVLQQIAYGHFNIVYGPVFGNVFYSISTNLEY